jgi:phosphohistidine phosphatase
VEIESLSPGGSQTDLLTWLAEHPRTSAVALVGHEPDLGEWLGLMLTGKSRGFAEFKKGSCALVEFEDKAEAGEGTLLWLLAPGQLRKLA